MIDDTAESDSNVTGIAESLRALRSFIEQEQYAGYDPYDALVGRIDFRRFGRWAPVLAIQALKRLPFNIRPLLGIEKGLNPKGMGLLLNAYSVLQRLEPDDNKLWHMRKIFRWLCDNRSAGYSGYCWGYNWDWANPSRYLPAYSPSVVATGFVAKGIYEYYLSTGDASAADVLASSAQFVLHDLHRTQLEDGICFSYTTLGADCCYNASLLGAENLAMAFAVTGDESVLEYIKAAVNFVVGRQLDDGRWNYSLNPESGIERKQVDFHQGFVIDSLLTCIGLAKLDDRRYLESVLAGAEFYRKNQFSASGRSYWRLPDRWPTDIHHQAQGVLTFSKLATFEPEYRLFAEKVARWTIDNMQSGDGSFYYRKGRFHTNKIPFMRWGQAWMMLALARLLAARSETE